jgi:hypothetical protein
MVEVAARIPDLPLTTISTPAPPIATAQRYLSDLSQMLEQPGVDPANVFMSLGDSIKDEPYPNVMTALDALSKSPRNHWDVSKALTRRAATEEKGSRRPVVRSSDSMSGPSAKHERSAYEASSAALDRTVNGDDDVDDTSSASCEPSRTRAARVPRE